MRIIRAFPRLTTEEITVYLEYLRSKDVSEMVFTGEAPRIVPDDIDDDPIVHTAVVGKAEILCTLNCDFYHNRQLNSTVLRIARKGVAQALLPAG